MISANMAARECFLHPEQLQNAGILLLENVLLVSEQLQNPVKNLLENVHMQV